MKDTNNRKAIKKLLDRLKFKREISQKNIIEAYLDYLERSGKHLKTVTLKDLISTIRHDFTNYDSLCRELHKLDKAKDVHRKFRNKVNGIIKEKFGHLLKW